MISVFDYFDYRDFLKELYNERKKGSPHFSYRFFSNRIGIDASSLIKIMQKQGHISTKSVPTLTKYLNLTDCEIIYLKTLIYYNKAKTGKDIEKHFTQLMALNAKQVKHIGPNFEIFYSHWCYKAIFMLLHIFPYHGNPDELFDKLTPPVTEAEIQKAILLLEQYGFIKLDVDGCYKPLYKLVNPECAHTTYKNSEIYQKMVTQLEFEAFDRFATTERKGLHMCLLLSEKGHQEMTDLIDTFRTEILRICGADKAATRVYQINAQLFPLSIQAQHPAVLAINA